MNMTSLIDITFLLLIYFMVSAVMSQPENRLTPSIRTQDEAASGVGADFQPQIIEVMLIEGKPRYRLGQSVFESPGELTRRLKKLPTELGVFVRGESGVSVGFAMAAIQAARDAGFDQVTYVPVDP